MPGADLELGRPRHIHIVGVGGAGMSAIATVLAAMGHRVTGSDLRPSAVVERLVEGGIDVRVGHDPDLVVRADLVAVSTAIPATDPEVEAARAAGIPVCNRARILAAICAQRRVLAVAGTHGKTTTSAMLTRILLDAGWAPSFIVGGEITGLGGGAGWEPAGEWLVVEADESDGTFVLLPREGGLVTSVEPDHLDFYGGEAAMRQAYEDFLTGCPGPRVVNIDEDGAGQLAARLRSQPPAPVSYGTDAGATFALSDVVERRTGIDFTVTGPDGAEGRVELAVPGIHNARNACGALALAVSVGVDFPAAVAGLARFGGVARRLQWRGERNGVTYVDDYAHLPGEVVTVLATEAGAGWGRVVAVFQPHRYSRTEALHASFADAFVDADVLVVTGIYPSGELARPGVTGRLVADAVAAAHPDADLTYCEDLAGVPDVLADILRPGDLCLTLGAGDLTELPDRMLLRP